MGGVEFVLPCCPRKPGSTPPRDTARRFPSPGELDSILRRIADPLPHRYRELDPARARDAPVPILLVKTGAREDPHGIVRLVPPQGTRRVPLSAHRSKTASRGAVLF